MNLANLKRLCFFVGREKKQSEKKAKKLRDSKNLELKIWIGREERWSPQSQSATQRFLFKRKTSTLSPLLSPNPFILSFPLRKKPLAVKVLHFHSIQLSHTLSSHRLGFSTKLLYFTTFVLGFPFSLSLFFLHSSTRRGKS